MSRGPTPSRVRDEAVADVERDIHSEIGFRMLTHYQGRARLVDFYAVQDCWRALLAINLGRWRKPGDEEVWRLIQEARKALEALSEAMRRR